MSASDGIVSAIEAKKPFERRERHTIMDGTVFDFAPAFEQSEGIIGPRYEARGWHISASRNAVVVHRADLGSGDAVRAFAAALAEAETLAADMGRRGNFDAATTPLSQYGASEKSQGDPQNAKNDAPRPKPTIAELEWILAAPDGIFVIAINPDGSVRADLGPKFYEMFPSATSSIEALPAVAFDEWWEKNFDGWSIMPRPEYREWAWKAWQAAACAVIMRRAPERIVSATACKQGRQDCEGFGRCHHGCM